LSFVAQERRLGWSWLPSELGWLAGQVRPLLHWQLASFLCITAGSFLALLIPLVLKWLIDQVIPQRRLDLLLLAVGLVFLGYQGRMALTSMGSYLMLSAAQKTALTLRVSLLRHLDTLSANYYEETPVGAVMYPLKEPIDEISVFGCDLMPAVLRALLTTCVTVATMFTLNPALTLSVLPVIPAFLIARQHFRHRLALDSDTAQRDRLAWSDFLQEHLSSVIPVQLLGQQQRQERRAFQLLAHAVRSQQRLFRSGVWFTLCSSVAVVVSMCSVIGYGGVKVLAGTLSMGGLVAFFSFVAQLFEPLSGAAELYTRAHKSFASIRQVQSAFALKPAVLNAAAAICLRRERPAQIDFAGVDFGYPRQKHMLQVPSLRISPGEKVAIVGNNGAGKSTLAKLIARIYDVDSGSIRIGGEDVRGIQLESLRRYVSYLPRDPILFNGSLGSNLRFGWPGAPDHALEEAIQLVGLSAFVATLPDGLRQRIGPGACQLSGGQRQRLAVARTLLQQPRILIVDEATSCLDSTSEELVLRDLQNQLPASTLIVVSHRPTTFSACARILTLSSGRIVLDSNHGSLMAGQTSAELVISTASTTSSDL
jgi:subfamily B ATP-binding cassette protein MsbA